MHFIYTFFIMFGFWIILSGKLDIFHLTLGILSSALVTFLSHDLLFRHRKKKGRLAEVGRFVFRYVPWLIYEIILATLHVSYLALHPRMKNLIDPKIIMFKTKLKKDISQVAMANSITLTPGTITIRITDNEFYVHALSKQAAEGLPGKMEEQVAKVFGEK